MDDIELFSLEDDDANELFITQTPKENLLSHLELSQNRNDSGIFGVEGDFQSPLVSVVKQANSTQFVYEDISDDENVFEKPTEPPNFQ